MFWFNDAGEIIRAGDVICDNTACPCGVPCASNNGIPIPNTLSAHVYFSGSTGAPFTLQYNATSNQWENISGDVFVCGNLYLRDCVMKCTGTNGVFFFEITIFATQQDVIGDAAIDDGIMNNDPFIASLTTQLTGYGISGVNCNDGDFMNIHIGYP
jgi:hypothetical protein